MTQENKYHYRVKVSYYYHNNTFGSPNNGYIGFDSLADRYCTKNDSNKNYFGVKKFQTKQDAYDFIEFLFGDLDQSIDEKYYYQKGTYVLAHGEFDRPDFKITKHKGGLK